MFEAEANNNRSILDYLNEDCWRIVLSYVPVLDIIRTEPTSRRWQRAVLIYLQGVRLRITSLEEEYDEKKKNIESYSSIRSLRLSRYGRCNEYFESFANWTSKLGASVVATNCKDLQSLKIVRANCPRLEALTLFNMYDLPESREEIAPHTLNKDFKYLKKLCFYESYASDDCVSQFIGDRALEELEFNSCYEITGQCLNIIKISNLKSLVFDLCYRLKCQYILLAMSQLNELTNFILNDVPGEIFNEIQLVLDKMAKLEWLQINQTVECIYSHARTDRPNLFHFEPLCRLNHLKYLSTGMKVTDTVVVAITQCCKELRSLEFSSCDALTSRAVKAICRNSGLRLTRLGLHDFTLLRDDDVVTCIRGCPKLTWLSVSGAQELTLTLPARAVAARHKLHLGHRLRLIISNTDLSYSDREIQKDYKDLILELN